MARQTAVSAPNGMRVDLVQARLRQASRGKGAAWEVLSPAAIGGPQQGSAADLAQQAQILEPFYQQFGFARSYFNQLMNSLVDTYGHLYNAMRPEVDMPDIILQRRILVGLLPALEKRPRGDQKYWQTHLGHDPHAVGQGTGVGSFAVQHDSSWTSYDKLLQAGLSSAPPGHGAPLNQQQAQALAGLLKALENVSRHFSGQTAGYPDDPIPAADLRVRPTL